MAAAAPRIIPMGYTPPTRPAVPKSQRFDDREHRDGIEIVVALTIALVLSLFWGSAMLAMRDEEPKEVLKAEVE
jgi:hypothetical protein